MPTTLSSSDFRKTVLGYVLKSEAPPFSLLVASEQAASHRANYKAQLQWGCIGKKPIHSEAGKKIRLG